MESESNATKTEFLQAVQIHLLMLYQLASQLPYVSLDTDSDFHIDIKADAIDSIQKQIGQKVPFSYYWVVLNPFDLDNSADNGIGDLIDDLGDIYKDLKKSLLVFDRSDTGAKESAIWNFKFDFDFHWNDQCIEAITAIHHYLAENSGGSCY